MSTTKIVESIAAIMAEVGAIGKNKTNQQQGYAFRAIDDVVAELQPLLAKHQLVMIPSVLEASRERVETRSGAAMFSTWLKVKHTFLAPDGSSVEAVTMGEAMDAGDKSTNKAMSAALKYALTETFLIPTHESDRDTEEHSPELAPLVPLVPPSAQVSLPARHADAAAPHDAPRVPFGTAKGKLPSELTEKELAFYSAAAERSIADVSKSRFVSANRAWLATLQAEMRRRATTT
jgi:hypothetical protein